MTFPLVRRSTMEQSLAAAKAEHEAALDALKKRHHESIARMIQHHEDDLKSVREGYAKVMEELAPLRCFHDEQTRSYAVLVQMDERLIQSFQLGSSRYSLEFLAREMAARVQMEIQSCRFVSPSPQSDHGRGVSRHQARTIARPGAGPRESSKP